MNKKISDDAVLSKRKKVATDLTSKIERMLESFEIEGIVQAVTFERRSVLLELQVADGVRVESIEQLRKTIASTVASPTGDVEIIAPLPGTTRIGIRVPSGVGAGWRWLLNFLYFVFGFGLLTILFAGFSNTMYQLINDTGKASPMAVGMYFVLVPIIVIVTIIKVGVMPFDAKFRSRGHKRS